MAKSIYFSDEQFAQITEAARQCGFRVQRGPGGQLALFVTVAANTACTGRLDSSANLSLFPAEVTPPAKARGAKRRQSEGL